MTWTWPKKIWTFSDWWRVSALAWTFSLCWYTLHLSLCDIHRYDDLATRSLYFCYHVMIFLKIKDVEFWISDGLPVFEKKCLILTEEWEVYSVKKVNRKETLRIISLKWIRRSHRPQLKSKCSNQILRYKQKWTVLNCIRPFIN